MRGDDICLRCIELDESVNHAIFKYPRKHGLDTLAFTPSHQNMSHVPIINTNMDYLFLEEEKY